MLRLPSDDQQYMHTVGLTGMPTGGTLLAIIGTDPTEHAMEADGDQFKLLVRGPDYADDATGVLVSASADVWVRVKDSPESVSVPAGRIEIVTRP